ncbi:surface lipoprotein assembly modifier, partial [Neisseria sp. P0024.S006]|uniref:surface lipoprotein assembly modifier n=1 Tax=Neisseria sp. P0024.S006 TaxID=3436850 RepID=UPI003F81957B
QLLSNSIIYYRTARQYWVAGLALYRERTRDDKSDSLNRYALRTTWGQEWPKGLSTVLRLSAAQRRYPAPGFFSNEQNRRDKEASAYLSVWHHALPSKGITQRMPIAHNKTWSNAKLYEHGPTKMLVELGTTF